MATFTPPNADAARARLLQAGRDEFAAVGLAGARIERIAAATSTNKAQVFHWFGSKEGLFDAVLTQSIGETLDHVPFDADDVPEYAGRLHDWYAERPWAYRLLTWYRLERGSDASLEALVTSHETMVAAVHRAQRAGTLPRSYRPAVLLGLVLHLAAFWGANTPEFDTRVVAVTPAKRRQAVVDAVASLVRQ